MESITQKIAGRAVILHEGKVLMIQESSVYEEGTNEGKWDFPGGRIHPGEPMLDALKRETQEECGLIVEIGKPLFVGEWSPTIKGQKMQIIGIYFLCTAENTDVVLGDDHDEYRWVDPAIAHDLALMPPNDKVLHEVTLL
jgi:8-oxo-dGTP pyrophosphatase MutT (NUDIX family)